MATNSVRIASTDWMVIENELYMMQKGRQIKLQHAVDIIM
jgi:hypothetical protein